MAEKTWVMEGALRDNYDAHEPMAMFPEPSSTVPNATYTQQRLLDEVMNPAFLGIEPETDAPPYQPAKSSVPWSDFLNTPSVRIKALLAMSILLTNEGTTLANMILGKHGDTIKQSD
jgi:hypothetical protein